MPKVGNSVSIPKRTEQGKQPNGEICSIDADEDGEGTAMVRFFPNPPNFPHYDMEEYDLREFKGKFNQKNLCYILDCDPL